MKAYKTSKIFYMDVCYLVINKVRKKVFLKLNAQKKNPSDYQSDALPTELQRLTRRVTR